MDWRIAEWLWRQKGEVLGSLASTYGVPYKLCSSMNFNDAADFLRMWAEALANAAKVER